MPPELVGALQGDLRSIAAGHLARERRDPTLQSTALVNEAYLRRSGRRHPDRRNSEDSGQRVPVHWPFIVLP